ncbi:MAG: translation initiation factor IF-2 [Lachnospiraceae bacterium]|nr:translation initiation factor IF-2 [Lachnospiraceae bacterium]
MAKMQIMKLTKELKEKGIEISNKEIVSFLSSQGVEVSNHMSSIDDKEIQMVRDRFSGKGGTVNKNPEKADAPANKEKQPEEAPKARPAQGAAPAQGKVLVKKKKPNIIFSTNTGNKNGRSTNANGRHIVHISGGKIEQPQARKPFKHVEVTSPESFQKKEEPVKPVVEQENIPAEPVKEEKAPESETAVKSPERKIFGNIFSESYQGSRPQRNNDSGNRGTNNSRNGGNYASNSGQRRERPASAPGAGPSRDRNASAPYGRNSGGPSNNQGNFRGNQRPGANRPGERRSQSFEGEAIPQDAEKHRSDASRRRQSEERKRKEQNYEKQREEKNVKKFNPHGFHKPAPVEKKPEEEIKTITIPDTLTIKELSDKMKMQPSAIVKKLFLAGQIVTLNSEISFEEAENIAIEYDIICEHEEKVDVIAELLSEEDDAEETLKKRPPVVCVMGHVDHGKTSLLDRIRKSHVTDKESGGITQAIGAYGVKIGDRKITFLDTPGHEAFTAMRMRGAKSTDIAILVVAADDGVMPQTVEAINHAKAAEVNIIVAVNKIDKPSANIERVKQELAEYELIPEDWGGDTVYVPVSAKSGEGIDQLLEMILLSADMLELKANPNRQARGLVIEARLDKGRGTVATLLIQKGTLHVGDCVAVGPCYGKVRAMLDENGKRVKEAGPSTPVEILGLNNVPDAGEIFVSPKTEKEAKNFAETYIEQHKKDLVDDTKKKMSLDQLYTQIQEGNLKEFNIIIKADVQGSVEAMRQSLEKLSNDEVVVKIIHDGVGAISESDVSLASASNAIIIGFNVRPDAVAKQSADTEEVDIRLYKVIYQAIDDVEAAMKGLLAPVYEEKIIGHAEIRQIFKASGIGNISGSYVLDGVVERGCSVRITREGEQIFEGKLASLKRFKDDVKEVKEGFECGLVFEDFDKVAELDQIEFYKMVEVSRE